MQDNLKLEDIFKKYCDKCNKKKKFSITQYGIECDKFKDKNGDNENE